jgi:hypothetical protein
MNGIEETANKNYNNVEICRRIAVEYAQEHGGFCSIEDVRDEAARRGYLFNFSGNWPGAIFKKKGEWDYAGTLRCVHPSGNSRRICQWKLLQPGRADRSPGSMRHKGVPSKGRPPLPELFTLHFDQHGEVA